MLIGPEVRVADIASQAPATIRIFQQHGIDFCCGGKRPLSEACAEAEAEYDRVRQDLEAALVNQPAPERSWAAVPLTELTDHIVSRYHQPLRQELAVMLV